MAYDPVIFISSTSDDLKEYREQAAKAAVANGFSPRMMEYFPASGHTPTLPACLEKVAEAEVVVVIVAHRYGWVPEGPENPDAKSITWLECDHARKLGKEVLAFLVDAEYKWPVDLEESYRLVTERNRREISREVARNEKKLAKFKKIRITGLKTKRTEPYVFGIHEIYIPLKTLSSQERHGGAIPEMEQRRVELQQALSNRKVVIVGEPGSGKSTFLRRVAFELCRTLRGTLPKDAPPFLVVTDRRFPILIRVAELAKVLAADKSGKPEDSPDWIPYFLGKQGDEYKWGVDGAFFRRKLEEGGCLVMVDGLDEAPERRMRERIARLFERATGTFKKCDFLVSTRPQTNVGDAVLAEFQQMRIGDLEVPEIRAFFEHFANGLALNEKESRDFKDGLETALAARPEILEMAGNPIMLTALAVLQHNDQRLPEYRVELYESILGWLAAAHEHKEGRLPATKCIEYMRKLALRMQDEPKGRLVQVNKRSAAELFTREFGGNVDANEELLERETQDSGIISAVGNDLKFWHLSFQEYLAAREIASLSDQQQVQRVVESGGPRQGENKIVRGGSWGSNRRSVRVACRSAYGPMERNAIIGFRCAGDLS